MKVGIVGMGWVGASVASSIVHSGVATDLLLQDVRPGLAEGEAMDLQHGSSFHPSASIRAAPIDEMWDADAVVVAAGRGGGPTESRLDLLRTNAAIVADISRQLSGMRGLLVIVTNPVDLMTQVAAGASGLPLERVIGTGTMLDTARLRQSLGQRLQLDPRSVHAQVVGEHGDSSVAVWSGARVAGKPLRAWPGWSKDEEPVVQREVRNAAYEIIQRKGATNHAIGIVTSTLLRWALRGTRRVLTVSRVQEGAMGIRDLAISLPTIVGRDGAVRVEEPDLDAKEERALADSVETLRSALRDLEVGDRADRR